MADTLSETLVRSSLKLTLGVIGLLVFRQLLVVAPGGDRALGGVDLTLGSVMAAVVGALVVGVLLYYAWSVSTTLRDSSMGTVEIRETASRAVLLLAAFIALFLFYGDLTTIVNGFVEGDSPLLFALDVTFLLGSLGILVTLGYIVFSNFDPLVDFLLDRFDRTSAESASEDDDTTEATCPDCQSQQPDSAAYCGNCGTKLTS